LAKNYVPTITSKVQSPEWDASFDRMFGRKPCKGCGCDMADEDKDALWCRKCKEAG
jgi:hypothetical protein